MPYILAFLLVLLVNLGGCSSGQRVGVFYQPNYNFSQVKSYSLYLRNSTFTEIQSLSDSTRNGVEIAVEKSMDSNGFQYSELVQTDIIVSYHLRDAKQDEFSNYNRMVRYCQSCLRANNWTKENITEEPPIGSLVLDLVDPITKRSVWRSFYLLNIKVKENSQEVNEKIQQAVESMLSRYPNQSMTLNRS